MNRKQRIDKILSNKFDNFLLEIIDNSKLHKGHNNFTGSGETHIKIILTKKDSSIFNRLLRMKGAMRTCKSLAYYLCIFVD